MKYVILRGDECAEKTVEWEKFLSLKGNIPRKRVSYPGYGVYEGLVMSTNIFDVDEYDPKENDTFMGYVNVTNPAFGDLHLNGDPITEYERKNWIDLFGPKCRNKELNEFFAKVFDSLQNNRIEEIKRRK